MASTRSTDEDSTAQVAEAGGQTHESVLANQRAVWLRSLQGVSGDARKRSLHTAGYRAIWKQWRYARESGASLFPFPWLTKSGIRFCAPGLMRSLVKPAELP